MERNKLRGRRETAKINSLARESAEEPERILRRKRDVRSKSGPGEATQHMIEIRSSGIDSVGW